MIKINDTVLPTRTVLECRQALDAVSIEMDNLIKMNQYILALQHTARRCRQLANEMDKLRETFSYK